jgi:hypothetical protein
MVQSKESNLKRSLAQRGISKNKGHKCSEESIKKQVSSRKGYKHSKETKEKQRIAAFNRKDKQIAWNKGLHTPDEVKQKQRIIKLGKILHQ